MRLNYNIQLSLLGLISWANFSMSDYSPPLIRAANYANSRSVGACAALGAAFLANAIISLDRKLDSLDKQITNLEVKTKQDLSIDWHKNLNKYTFGPYQYTDYRDLRIKWDVQRAQKQVLNNGSWWDSLRNYFKTS